MANFFGLLFFIFIIVTIILLVKPSLTAIKNKSPLPRLKILVYGFLATLFSMVMIGLTAPKVDPKKLELEQFSDDQVKVSQDKDGKIVVTPQEVKNKVSTPDSNLGMTPEEFRKRFNAKLDQLDIDSIRPIAEFKIKQGNFKDTFQVKFSNALSLTGTVNKDGSLRELIYIMGGTQDFEGTMMELLILSGISSQIISPNEPKVNNTVIELINKAVRGIEKEDNSHSEDIGDVKYYTLASKATGLWFGISPKKDN
ncbi:hypothetical protein ABW55_16095 [Acinetobacter sp. C15]|uniref:hypothetical protein n=1 Tax=Acinetobacter sp. C15 TaxID=1661746 RepID=UPI0006AB782D|nr:hypothetical protein [Acinetobacter sp. C15]KOR09773.1 hypothetical protein ABW55_16095 [Acinetobacter sp. C15]